MQPTESRVTNLFEFEVTGISTANVETAGGDGARGGCRSNLFEESAGTLRLAVKEWIKLPQP